MMDCKEALPMLHEYMDETLDSAESARLKEHLAGCASCRQRLRQFEKVEALIHAWTAPAVPAGLSERVMQALPPVRRVNPWYRWIRNHPAASVAVIFIAVMLSAFLSTWNEDRELLVKGSDLQSVVIKGDTVYVPKGSIVVGDLTVEQGNVVVDGDVEGSVVVIDGSVSLASTAHISGQIQEIDEVFGWLWFKMNHWLNQVAEHK